MDLQVLISKKGYIMKKKELEDENARLHKTIETLWGMIHFSDFEIDRLKFEKKELEKKELESKKEKEE